MEAHSLLKRQGFDVSSYGTGAHVKLPGPSIREPNVYEFGTPYKQMFEELRRKDPELYPFLLFSFWNLSFTIDFVFEWFWLWNWNFVLIDGELILEVFQASD